MHRIQSRKIYKPSTSLICDIRNYKLDKVLYALRHQENITDLIDLRCEHTNSCALEWCILMAKINIYNRSHVLRFLYIGFSIFRRMIKLRKYTSLRTRNYNGMTFLVTLLDTYMYVHARAPFSVSKLFLTFIHDTYKYVARKNISSYTFALGILWNTPTRKADGLPPYDTKQILFDIIGGGSI